MEDARKQNGRVYVHCVQGISRSSTLCICYLIFTRRMTFQEGFTYCKQRRGCVNPNMTFIAQLVNFYKRLYDDSFDSLPVSPRVFQICSHQKEDPFYVVARFQMDDLYCGREGDKTLDPRGIFIIQTKTRLYLWKGAQILPQNEATYEEAAHRQIKLMQQYERAPPGSYPIVRQGEEDTEFWAAFNNPQKQ